MSAAEDTLFGSIELDPVLGFCPLFFYLDSDVTDGGMPPSCLKHIRRRVLYLAEKIHSDISAKQPPLPYFYSE